MSCVEFCEELGCSTAAIGLALGHCDVVGTVCGAKMSSMRNDDTLGLSSCL